MTTPDMPPPDQARNYFCNKCGFIGPTDHALDGSNNCHYCAIAFGPFWGAQKVLEYGDARAAAAVLAEREKSEAMRAALTELVACDDLHIRAGKISPVEPGCEKEVLMDEWRRRNRIAWAAARAAIRAE